MAKRDKGIADIPATPRTSSSVRRPAYNTLIGVAGRTPVIGFPDVNGTSPNKTQPG